MMRGTREVDVVVEAMEWRVMMAVTPVVQSLVDSANLYSVSGDASDLGSPIVPIYTEYRAGGTFLSNVFASNVTLNGDDPDAGKGFSSWSATLQSTTTNGWFEFVTVGAARDIPDYGHANTLRFMAKGDAAGQQVLVNVFNTVATASQTFTLGTTWQDYSVSLPAGVKPSGVTGVQFVTGGALNYGNGTFRVDEVRLDTDGYDPLRVVQSYRQGNWAAVSPGDPVSFRDGEIYPNHSYLYDNAVAIKALAASGDAGARLAAKQIADAEIATVRADGSYFNERNSGHVLDGSGTVRAAFSPTQTLGDNAWFGMALVNVYDLTGDVSYLNRAKQISDWAETNLKATGALKGYKGGYDSGGAALPWRSTEHNIDLFELDEQIADALLARGDAAASTYAQRAMYAGDFVMSMYSPADGKFWTGTDAADGTNKDSVPLDVNIWSGLSLGLSAPYAGAIDWTKPRVWAEGHLAVTDGAYAGYTFSDHSTPGVVWSEGTGGVAVLDAVQGQSAKYSALLANLEALRANHPNGNGQGLVAASHDSLLDGNLGATYDARMSVAAAGWLAYAEQKTNPFANPVGISATADARYTISGTFGGAQTLNVTAGAVTFANDLSTYYQNLTVTVGAGATVVFAGDQHLGSLNVNGGVARLTAAARRTITVGALTIGAGGTLDLGAGNLVVSTLNGQAATAASVQALVKQAAGTTRASGRHPWNGVGGITSALAQSDGANSNALGFAIGVADAADNGVTHLGLLTGQVTARVAAYGDANLDNVVDIADLSAWNNGFASGSHWAQGDFNYDGVVDIADLSVWNNNFAGSVTPGETTSTSSGVGGDAVAAPTAAPGGAVVTTARGREGRRLGRAGRRGVVASGTRHYGLRSGSDGR